MAARRRVYLLTILLMLPACADFRAAWKDAKKCESDLKSELGLDAHVGFRTFSATKGGRHLSVNVHLAAAPPGDACVAKGKITEVVFRDFREHPDHVSVSF
ncbi:MAG: hypothetical protein ACRENE_31485 [Polyangiaceae bacterium]